MSSLEDVCLTLVLVEFNFKFLINCNAMYRLENTSYVNTIHSKLK